MTLGRCPLSIFCSRGTPPEETLLFYYMGGRRDDIRDIIYNVLKRLYKYPARLLENKLFGCAVRAGGSCHNFDHKHLSHSVVCWSHQSTLSPCYTLAFFLKKCDGARWTLLKI